MAARPAYEFVLDGPDAIARLKRDRSLWPAVRRIAVTGVDEPARGRFETEINRTYFACGCQWGAVAVLMALCGLGLVAYATPVPLIGLWWKGLLTVAVASVVGKAFGLLLSRYRLRRALGRLAIEMGARDLRA